MDGGLRIVLRTLVILGLAVGLLYLFLRNADLGKVLTSVRAARVDLLVVSVVMTCVTFLIRAERWQYLLAPLGPTRFMVVLRTTVIGFAASAVLPARAGEVIRPYLLARKEGLSATAAFATIIVERILDLVAVLLLLAAFLLWFDPGLESRDSAMFSAIRYGGFVMAPVALGMLVVMFVMAGHPERLHGWLLKAERVLPARIATWIARLARTFAEGFAVLRSPWRVVAALGWSIALWVVVAGGLWAVAVAFRIDMPMTGSLLMLAPLVVGVAVPTPGGVGGFHEAFRLGATSFFGADNDTAVGAAIVLHAIGVVPVVIAGMIFTIQEGLKIGGLARGDLG
ncbi:MAG: lysylphosphatidylglycerol synthase transmembrane domain-containing protein [Acidobacteriota bacterium]|nr:lysylphosphatidylglycerol synthase transmembrane domain-containing protein [Acidobacteriota bacterium]MDP2389607.1 lysylphosphatidylglycerol synthase transmembrane domain-containing protein [Acidobacteriota bacterium]